MGMTKIHRTDASNSHHSTKWLPSVSQEKTSNTKTNRTNAAAKTTKLQIGNNEIAVTNQAQSPGPSSIKMYNAQAHPQHQ